MHSKTVLFQIVAISLCILSCLGGDVVSFLHIFFIFVNLVMVFFSFQRSIQRRHHQFMISLWKTRTAMMFRWRNSVEMSLLSWTLLRCVLSPSINMPVWWNCMKNTMKKVQCATANLRKKYCNFKYYSYVCCVGLRILAFPTNQFAEMPEPDGSAMMTHLALHNVTFDLVMAKVRRRSIYSRIFLSSIFFFLFHLLILEIGRCERSINNTIVPIFES